MAAVWPSGQEGPPEQEILDQRLEESEGTSCGMENSSDKGKGTKMLQNQKWKVEQRKWNTGRRGFKVR